MPTDPRLATLALLQSIDATLKAILLVLSENRNEPAKVPDAMLNGPHGDPVVKAKDPRDWTGEPMQGRKFSECPPEYLDLLADRYDYFATKAETSKREATDDDELQKAEKSLKYAVLDAKRARGWAARLRAGYVAPSGQTVTGEREPAW